jgi:hypothetical protein
MHKRPLSRSVAESGGTQQRLLEATIAQLKAAMNAGRTSAVELTNHYSTAFWPSTRRARTEFRHRDQS